MAKGKKTGGRAPGTPNKLTRSARQIFHDHRYDPLVSSIQEAKRCQATLAKVRAKKTLTQAEALELSGVASNLQKLNKELVPYLHPKLSTVEHVGEGGGPLTVTINYGDD